METTKTTATKPVEQGGVEETGIKFKPLEKLCKDYRVDYSKVLAAGLCNYRLYLFFHNKALCCREAVFRAFLEIEAQERRYTEKGLCSYCNKEQPLYYFSYGQSGELEPFCRDCRKKKDDYARARLPYGSAGNFKEDSMGAQLLYKSPIDFIGKQLYIERKTEEGIADFLSMKIKTVAIDEATGAVLLSGENNKGKAMVQHLMAAEAHSICYEGCSTFWSEQSHCLYKKVITNKQEE